jgi:hypothetical protein
LWDKNFRPLVFQLLGGFKGNVLPDNAAGIVFLSSRSEKTR